MKYSLTQGYWDRNIKRQELHGEYFRRTLTSGPPISWTLTAFIHIPGTVSCNRAPRPGVEIWYEHSSMWQIGKRSRTREKDMHAICFSIQDHNMDLAYCVIYISLLLHKATIQITYLWSGTSWFLLLQFAWLWFKLFSTLLQASNL
jgi:hypothetical protein